MEKQLMKLNKWAIIFFTVGILILIFSIGYYLVVFNAKWKKETDSMQKESYSIQKNIEELKSSAIFQDKNINEEEANIEVESEDAKQFNTGDQFVLKSGKKVMIDWVTVNNMYTDGLGSPLRGVVQIKINSKDGSLGEADYNRLYLTIGKESYNLSNQDPERGDYWFYIPCVRNFKDANLHFGSSISVILRESLFRKSLNVAC